MVRIRGMTPATLLRAALAGLHQSSPPQHVFICVADHYEPDWRNASRQLADERVQRWLLDYPRVTEGLEDSRGRAPQHTFFYPAEVYVPEHLDALAQLARNGRGDVEVHLHHDNDRSDRLREFLIEYAERLHNVHGLLRRDDQNQIRYGFVHGNWALDNSRPDGTRCGVNDEITVLIETGCYADFTMPAAPDPCQVRTINQIYYAKDDPNRPCSHDRGVASIRGHVPRPDQLLMIPGPLCVRRLDLGRGRKWSLENGNLTATQPPTLERLQTWLACGVGVKNRPDWGFIKLHTHGAQEDNAEILLSDSYRQFHQQLQQFAQTVGMKFYYVTAYEMAQLVRQAEQNIVVPDFARLSG